MQLRGKLLSVAAIGAGVLAPCATASAASSPTEAQLDAARAALVRTVVAQIPGARSVGDAEDPLVGVPGIADLAVGRTQVMLDPAFWTQVVWNLLASQTVVLPQPVDLVKPEAALPTAVVEDGDEASPLPQRDVDLRGVEYEWAGRKKTLEEFVTSTETDVVAFVHQGRIVEELYANGWSSEVRHQPWSVTKSFVSSLVGIAAGEGLVRSVDEPIEAYIPELRGTAWQGTTIQNLLEMESGVHWDEGTPVLAVNTQVQQWVQMIVDHVTGGALGQTRNEFLASLPRVAEQGTKFSYNSGNTQLLAWLLEKVYAKPFNRIVSEKLWVPAGMADSARVMTDRVGDAVASQGLYSKVFDLARFGELFRNGGVAPSGRQVVPADWVRRSTTMTEISKGNYAWQWWHGPTPNSYDASGFQGQKISVSPDHCLTGVRLSHTLGLNMSDGVTIEAGSEEWDAVYRAVAAKLGTCDRGAVAGAAATRAARLRLGRATRMSRRAALGRRALRVVLGSSRAGRSVTLRAVARRAGRTVVVADRRLTLRSTRARTVSLPLTAAGRRLLRADRAVRLVLTARSGATTVRRTVVVR